MSQHHCSCRKTSQIACQAPSSTWIELPNYQIFIIQQKSSYPKPYNPAVGTAHTVKYAKITRKTYKDNQKENQWSGVTRKMKFLPCMLNT